ncbi:MAG: hypothetical protein PHU65_05430 [Actinomycetota bacterium]|jgi:hypothetical protein|nr:hypothetical protein [Actinomycetota bacterium]
MQRRVFVREIYFYIVCVIAIIVFIIGIIGLANAIVNYIKPNTYMTKSSMMPGYKEMYEDMSEQELNALIEEEMQSSIANERNFAFKSIISNSIMIIIAIPLFAFHWKKAQELWKLNMQ